MVSIVVHGGAGTIRGDDRRKLSADGMDLATDAGYQLLLENQSSIAAVKEAVRIMENLPQFNAGYGSVITAEETIEMDALIVDGYTGNMGGVLGISRIKNPIDLCEVIMNESDHLLFAGKGAELFAESHGFSLIDPNTLITDRVRERFRKWKIKKKGDQIDPEGRDKFGTVGAVAIDNDGKLAAATSTGGTLGKTIGRIGDTPIFGAGTYADQGIAISATGVGEYIIQAMIGIRIKHLTEKYELKQATHIALDEANRRFGPMGVICLDSNGIWTALKTTKDLAYAYKTATGSGNFLSDTC